MKEELLLFYPVGHEAHALPNHPERPDRIWAIRNALEDGGWWSDGLLLEPVEIPDEVMAGVHTQEHVETIKKMSQVGGGIDLDTYLTRDSYRLALNAAGGTIAVAKGVWEGRGRRGFALARPPGHHATRTRAMGFCLLNNIALAAEYLRKMSGAQRVAIVDIDLHHGNGTQDIFYARPDVLFISTHEFPLYPGTGGLYEMGAGAGKGYTINLPFPGYTGDDGYAAALYEIILPSLSRFNPEIVLVSLGMDAHWLDPLGNMVLSGMGYYHLISGLSAWCDAHCDGRIVLVLEGGYDLQAADLVTRAVASALSGEEFEDPIGMFPRPSNRWQDIIHQAKELWKL